MAVSSIPTTTLCVAPHMFLEKQSVLEAFLCLDRIADRVSIGGMLTTTCQQRIPSLGQED